MCPRWLEAPQRQYADEDRRGSQRCWAPQPPLLPAEACRGRRQRAPVGGLRWLGLTFQAFSGLNLTSKGWSQSEGHLPQSCVPTAGAAPELALDSGPARVPVVKRQRIHWREEACLGSKKSLERIKPSLIMQPFNTLSAMSVSPLMQAGVQPPSTPSCSSVLSSEPSDPVSSCCTDSSRAWPDLRPDSKLTSRLHQVPGRVTLRFPSGPASHWCRQHV